MRNELQCKGIDQNNVIVIGVARMSVVSWIGSAINAISMGKVSGMLITVSSSDIHFAFFCGWFFFHDPLWIVAASEFPFPQYVYS
jgi:hypothetical protein